MVEEDAEDGEGRVGEAYGRGSNVEGPNGSYDETPLELA
jgi:hypothetical protein